MSVTGNSAFKQLKVELESLSGHQFQRRCHQLMKCVWSETQYAQDLGLHDRLGVDCFLADGTADQPRSVYSLVVQCKGLEKLKFDDANLKDAVKSIRKIANSGLPIRKYWLVVNRFISEAPLRNELCGELEELVHCGAVQEAVLFEHQLFLKTLIEELIPQIRQRMVERNRHCLLQYVGALRKGIAYIPEVPFHEDSGKSRNPTAALASSLERINEQGNGLASGRTAKKWRFILSEFGFGKTSLLLNLAQEVQNRSILYQPICELDKNSFQTEYDFTRSLYRKLYPEDGSEMPSAYLPLIAFRQVMRFDPQFLLLLDGLDEHRVAYKESTLCTTFHSLGSLACDIVITARKEYFEKFSGSIEMAMRNVGKNRRELYLDEWDSPLLLKFLDGFPNSPGIRGFRSLVKAEKYESVYGDIPKRPLFLQMLAEDLVKDEHCATNLAELYERYFHEKLDRDVLTPFAFGDGGGRALSVEGLDRSSLKRSVYEILEEIARLMLVPDDPPSGAMLLRESVTEDEVLNVIKAKGFGPTNLVDLLQNSLLVTTSSRWSRRGLELRFAHASFLEFFAASWLVQHQPALLQSKQEHYPPGVVRFAKHMLGNPRS